MKRKDILNDLAYWVIEEDSQNKFKKYFNQNNKNNNVIIILYIDLMSYPKLFNSSRIKEILTPPSNTSLFSILTIYYLRVFINFAKNTSRKLWINLYQNI